MGFETSTLKCVIRPVIEYCADIMLPNSYFSKQFQRVQKLAVRSYCGDFTTNYDVLLTNCNLSYLSNRRAACAVVNLQKYLFGQHFMLQGFYCFGTELATRRSARRDTARDLLLLRNYPTDLEIKTFRGFSPSFKKSFLFRAITNYNHFRREIDLDSFYFIQLRRVLSLFNYDINGIIIV